MGKIKKVAVLTSGGDAPGMNAAIRAVVRCCAYNGLSCVGIFRGFAGLIEADFKELDARSVKNLINKGGTFLKSARCDEFRTSEGRLKAVENLRSQNIDALVVIGGDGSFIGASILAKDFDFPVVGIPATIDNDIQGTDYTIGYDTALNTVMEAVDKIRDTASSHNRLFLVEVMGRDAGNIALNAGIGVGAEEILIPEQNRGLQYLLDSLCRSKKSGKTSSIVLISEGGKIGKNIFELAAFIEGNLPEYEVRVTVLGHIQRGGVPSCYDRILASRLGVGAIDALIGGEKNTMLGMVHNKITCVPFSEMIKGKRPVDLELVRVADIISI